MGARFDCLTIHAWYWMQNWRVASSAGESRGAKRRKGRLLLPPWSEEVMAASWLRLPPGALFAGRLGLDLGIAPDLVLGARRYL
jgi:hypothetical protein